MKHLALVWPGVALSITMVDDVVAGPLIALGGAVLGPWVGIPVAMVVFTVLVGFLVWSALAASRELDPALGARIDEMVDRASRRRVVGRFVRRVGDGHPVATAAIAVLVSPVFAVLLARLVHPRQRLRRTALVSAAAYGLCFAVGYAAGGSAVAGLL